MAKEHGSVGSVPRGKGGTGKPVDHGSMGKLSRPSNQTMPATVHAAGKPVRHDGGKGKAVANPKVKCHAQGPQGKMGGGW